MRMAALCLDRCRRSADRWQRVGTSEVRLRRCRSAGLARDRLSLDVHRCAGLHDRCRGAARVACWQASAFGQPASVASVPRLPRAACILSATMLPASEGNQPLVAVATIMLADRAGGHEAHLSPLSATREEPRMKCLPRRESFGRRTQRLCKATARRTDVRNRWGAGAETRGGSAGIRGPRERR